MSRLRVGTEHVRYHPWMTSSLADAPLGDQFEQYRPSLTGFCYRMMGSPVDAQDAVQETMLRAWRAQDRFEGRSQVSTWLHRIATNVCLDILKNKERRVRPIDLGPAAEPIAANLNLRPEVTWLEPIPDRMMPSHNDPSETVVARETVSLAFVAALQRLPARQRSALILCDVLRWQASEAAELLDMTTASVNSALQRARVTLENEETEARPLTDEHRALLDRYVTAFERYDVDALSEVLRDDARQSMPPYDLWLDGRDDVFAWWFGPGIACKGSRVLAAGTANGLPAFAQYKPDPDGGYSPWALQVVESDDDGISEITFFLSAERLFPLFGMPLHLDDHEQ